MANIGVRIMKIAAIAKLISIMYLSTGNILLPIQPSKYLYPSSSSHLLKNKVRTEKTDNNAQKAYAIDYNPSTIKGEIIFRLS